MSTKILITDPLSDKGISMLEDAGFEVLYKPKVSMAELDSIIDFDLTVIHNSLQLVSNKYPDFQDLTAYSHFLTYGLFYKAFSFFDHNLISNIDLLVKLENPEFESEFAVYSGDQIESRYILSSSLMERILSFKKQTKKKIQLSFVDSRLYVTVPYSKNLFEPKLFGDIVNFDHIKEYHNDLSLVLDLIQTLNLNTRIWTKE